MERERTVYRNVTICLGTASDHCCWVARAVCPHLEERTVPGRRWACGLRRELGSWEAVHADARYLTGVKSYLETTALGNMDCGDWPPVGVTCPSCGAAG